MKRPPHYVKHLVIFAGVVLACLYSAHGAPKKSLDKKPAPVVVISTKNYNILSKPERLILLDIHADWCDPCRKMKTVFEQAAHTLHKKMTFAKILIDNFDETNKHVHFLKQKYRVSIERVPTLLLIKNDRVIEKIEGYMSLENLKNKLNSAIKSL